MSFFTNLSQLFGPQAEGKRANQAPAKQASHKPVKPTPATDSQSTHRQPQRSLPPTRQPAPAPRMQPSQSSFDQQNAAREAQAKAREIIVEAKDEALAIRSKAENEARDLRRQLEEQQRSLDQKLDRLELKFTQLTQKEADLTQTAQKQQDEAAKLVAEKQKVINQLEKVANLTTDQARQQLFEQLESRLTGEMARFIKQKEDEAKVEAEEKAREILVDAMKHGATDYVPEYTISTVTIPSEEAKGKIIGKAGRNIHTFERVTGVDVDLDTSPTEVRLSCFDPVRREIARVSLERLIKDGRIQPTRIEEVVAKVSQEMDKILLEAGRNLCHEVGVYNLPTELMRMLGKFKFRFSYGQNLIAHTLEETKIGMKLASELGADVNVVKLGCLLHDIGKVSDEAEGSHVELGVKIAKKYGLPKAVIDCIAQHHEDEPFSGVEQVVVYIADAISGARPGARYENYEEYVERLQKLEEIANSYSGVRQSYAIQAGREIRVILDPEQSKDDDVKVLAQHIRDDIKEKVTYPGTVTVTVLRELRSQQVAA